MSKSSLKLSRDHLQKALLLVRELRFKAVEQGIDPVATRVALKFCLMVDTYEAKKVGLTDELDNEITECAETMFQIARKKWEKQDKE